MSNSSEAWHTQTRRITRSVIVNRELALWGTLSLLENRYLWPFMVIYIINTHMVIVYMVQYKVSRIQILVWLEVNEKNHTHTHTSKHGVYDIIAFLLMTMDRSCVDPSVTQRSVLILLITLICYSKLIGWWVIDHAENVDWMLTIDGSWWKGHF